EGPYEAKIVMHQGNTDINGPHQGGIVQLKNGNWWFMHFQDHGAWGRVDLLEPVEWINGWPLIGKDINNDGIGEPVSSYSKPEVGKQYSIAVPQTSDEFDSNKLGLQWQWHANPQQQWYSLTKNPGSLRLYTVQNITQNGNLWFVPNLLLQKFPAPAFAVTTKITFQPKQLNEMTGLVIMGKKWAFLGMKQTDAGLQLGMYTGTYFEGSDQTELLDSVMLDGATCYLRVHVNDQALCSFYYSTDNKEFHLLGPVFTATQGVWIGAKVGLFSLDPNMNAKNGFADVDWFSIK
ncbi:MAG TPA: glycoside hydrolase, partial [Bacteroidales bacterium]|nr:glycoside hydrolase [Bacteroidales bacterium]